ncbi:MAG: SDR family NAD(P)-dependent oxidoreductase [Rubricella sp.]
MTVGGHQAAQHAAEIGQQKAVVDFPAERGAKHLLMPGASDYQTAKHAINRLCEFVQSDHAEDGIKCFAIHPGGVATELGYAMPEQLHEYLIDSPDLAACYVVWLSSGAADWAKGRYLSATWDVEELAALEGEILRDDLLINRLRAKV